MVVSAEEIHTVRRLLTEAAQALQNEGDPLFRRV